MRLASTRRGRSAGFTLVELLVVIGIIALLISILLPALNRARQAANSAACLSNEHQIGLTLMQYASLNHGYLPYGNMVATQWGGPWSGPCCKWEDTLSLLLNKASQEQNKQGDYGSLGYWTDTIQSMAYDFNGMFHDKEVGGSGWANRASDYSCNARIMPDINFEDLYAEAITGKPSNTYHLGLRKIANIHLAQNIMMVWDAGITLGGGSVDLGVNGNDVATQLDDGSPTGTFGAIYPNANPTYSYYGAYGGQAARVAIGSNPYGWSGSGGDTVASLKVENTDNNGNGGTNGAAAMRFRHSANTTTNCLFVDGHCESRRLGGVVGRDVNVNAPSIFAPPPGM